MDSFNKVISFILGLVVVIVFVAVLMGKIKLGGKGFPLIGGSSVSPTPSVTANKTTPAPGAQTTTTNPNTNTNYKPYVTGTPPGMTKSNTPSTIPSTGLPTIFIPSLMAIAAAGGFLRRTGKS